MPTPMYYVRVRRTWLPGDPMPPGSRAFVAHAHHDLVTLSLSHTLEFEQIEAWHDRRKSPETWRGEMLEQMHVGHLTPYIVHTLTHAASTPTLSRWRTLDAPVYVKADYVRQAPGAESVAGVTLRLLPAYAPRIDYELSSRARSQGFMPEWLGAAAAAMTHQVELDGVNALRCEILGAMTHPVDTRPRAFAYAMCTAWRMVVEWAEWFESDDFL